MCTYSFIVNSPEVRIDMDFDYELFNRDMKRLGKKKWNCSLKYYYAIPVYIMLQWLHTAAVLICIVIYYIT